MVFSGFLLGLALYIPILLICLLISLLPNWRTLPHVWTFVLSYLLFECLGVLRLTWVWICYRNKPTWILKNRLVQIWWADQLLKIGTAIFNLKFEVTGRDALEGPSAILFVKHTSIGDTVMPLVFFSKPRNYEGIRYFIKNELLISPSLDIGAHRLSTLFVDRTGTDTDVQLEKIAAVTQSAPDDESLMIYPEGTRATDTKRAQLRNKHPQLIPQLDRWPNLLPPRLGGVSTLLANNPGKDVVFMAHTGFEGSADLAELLSGSWRGMTIRIHMWRVPYEQIPADHEAFIFEHWDQMNVMIDRLNNSAS